MTPEQKAGKIVEEINCLAENPITEWNAMVAIIAQAIKDAEQEAYAKGRDDYYEAVCKPMQEREKFYKAVVEAADNYVKCKEKYPQIAGAAWRDLWQAVEALRALPASEKEGA